MMAKPRQKKMAALAAVLFWVVFLLWPWAVPARAESGYSGAVGVFRFVQGENDLLAPAVICTTSEKIWCFTIPVSESDAQQMDAVAGALVGWEKWHLVTYSGNLGSISMWTMAEYDGESQAPRPLVMAEQGTACTLVYAISTSDYGTVQGVTLGELVDADNHLITIDGVGSQEINFPAALVDRSGNIIAVAVSSSTAFAVMDTDTYGSAGGTSSGGAGGSENDGGSRSPLMVGVVFGCAALFVYGFFKRKKNQAPPAAQNNEISPASPAYHPVPDSTESVTRLDSFPPTGSVEPQPNPPQLCLVATGGYMMGRIYPMETAELTIGRSPTAAIPYKVESVSKLHCKLYRNQIGRWMLMDCNSRNGTYLKRLGKLSPMQPVEVFPGDVFFLGSPQYSFEIRS